MTSGECWGIKAGFLEEGASGAGFGFKAIPSREAWDTLHKPVEASWGRRA